ncbi:AraC family transcriptional regulator N-terminal domain-containing protein [Alcanivorax sp.]|uniref:AraC family transcriptional regulator N-terminal domain-containing protein n=1 Tax=Alcanivorax sp. TaxID=1872427 RepID=UPI0032D8C227
MAIHRPIPRTPRICEPSLNIIAQGDKTDYLGDREIHYGPGQYRVQVAATFRVRAPCIARVAATGRIDTPRSGAAGGTVPWQARTPR